VEKGSLSLSRSFFVSYKQQRKKLCPSKTILTPISLPFHL